jgi:Domain of unknown function (DUF4062)/AAA ATPase domain
MGQAQFTGERRTETAVGVYVSSTWLDLRMEREAVEKVLHRFQTTKFVGMEYFGSKPEDTAEASLAGLERCRVYVGIFGARYGSGIAEMEYRRAREKGLDCLIYFQAGPCEPECDRLRTELRSAHTVTEFRRAEELASKVAADLHNWIFDKWLADSFRQAAIDGIDTLPMDYASRIENFLAEYLGTTRRPVPFGGRAAEMEKLDAWLDAGAETPPYALLAASAGRGKSALVTRWSRTLLGRADVSIIFLPISIRFRTNLASVVFASLAARLARVFGEEIRWAGEMTVEVWRGLVSSYLRRRLRDGQRLVVVLDGLDEAADWIPEADLFPQQPPEGLKVLVTARYRTGDVDGASWIQTLGWEHGLGAALDVDPLTREGVADVLLRMGAPLEQLGTRVDITGELHRLSEGDPLLVRLHVDDLWSRGAEANRLRPKDLKNITPGLPGYFQRWWREQQTLWGTAAPLKEAAVQSVLNLLACALGPMKAADLLSVAPDESGLNTWTLDEALRPLNRFVIGDGHEQGFVFSHPRLSIYFYELLTPQERRKWEMRFLDWGSQCLQALECGTSEPSQAPGYLVQYYGAHLERAQAGCESLLALMSNSWREAWQAFEGAFSGFLNDVERAWRSTDASDEARLAKGVDPVYLHRGIECALCVSSVRSLAANIHPDLLKALLESGVWKPAQALAFLRQTPDQHQKMSGLARIAHCLPDGLLEQALSLGEGLAPASLLVRLAECGRAARAIHLLESGSIWVEEGGRDEFGWWTGDTGYREARESAAAGMAPWLTAAQAESVLRVFGEAGDAPTIAVEALGERLEPERRREVLIEVLSGAIRAAAENRISRIASRLDPQTVWEVWRDARPPGDEWDSRLVDIAIAHHVPPAVRECMVADLRHEVLRDQSRSERRVAVLSRLLPLVEDDGADELSKLIARSSTPVEVLRRSTPYLRECDIRHLADVALEDIEERKEIVSTVAGRMPPEMWQGVLEKLLTESVHPRSLAIIAPYLPDAERRRAFELMAGLEDEQDRGSALWALAPVLDSEEIERAVAMAEEVSAPASTYPRLALRLAELGRWQAAIERVDVSGWNRDEVLKAVAEGIGSERTPAHEEALRGVIARSAPAADPGGLIGAIAGKLPAKLLREALQVVQRIGDTDAQDRAREALARELIATGSVEDVLRIVEQISGNFRDEVLESVAGALAENGHERLGMGLVARIVDDGAAERVLRLCLTDSSEAAFGEALAVVKSRKLTQPSGNFDPRFVLIERWPDSRAAELPDLMRGIGIWNLSQAFNAVPDSVARRVGRELIQIACVEEWPYHRASWLSALAPKLEGSDRATAISEMMSLISGPRDAGKIIRLARVEPWEVDDAVDLLLRQASGENAALTADLLRILSKNGPRRIWQRLWDLTGDSVPAADRAIIRAQLAATASGEQKNEASASAMAAATAVMPEKQRRRVLMEIAHNLAEPMRTEAWRSALELATLEESQADKAMAEVIAQMPDDLLRDAIATVAAQPLHRESIVMLTDRLGDEFVEQALRTCGKPELIAVLVEARGPDLDQIARIPSPGERAYEIAMAADSLDDAEDQAKAVAIAQAIDRPSAKAYALEALARLGFAGATARHELIHLVASGSLPGDESVRVLNSVADADNVDWREAARTTVRRFQTLEGIENLSLIAPLASVLSGAERLRFLGRALRRLATMPRPNLLSELKGMTGWIRAIGGATTLNETSEAMARVTAWWP